MTNGHGPRKDDMIDSLITYIPLHDARLFELLCAFFSTLSLLFAFSRRTVWLSKLFGTVTPADLGRAWRYLLKALELIQQWRAARKAINGALLVLILASSSGCAGTFEEAKLAGSAARKAAPPMAASSPQRCQSLSEREYWFTGLGVASGAIGAAAGTMTIPIESKTVDTVLIVTTVAGGVGAGAFGWFGSSAATNYVREGCGQ